MKHFVPNTIGAKIMTPNGYKDFAGVAYMGDKKLYRVSFSNRRSLECTHDHKLICPTGILPLHMLRKGDRVFRGDGRQTRVVSIEDTGRVEPVYDIIEVAEGNNFTANGINVSNCEFLTDDETLIHPLTLAGLKGLEDPLFFTGAIRWYAEPEPNRVYMVALDPSLGTGRDYAAIQVFSMPEMQQVAEWQHNKTDPRGQVRILLRLLMMLDSELRNNPDQYGDPEIYWTVENNTIGEAILTIIEDTGEERFPGTMVNEKRRPGQSRRFRKGLNTDNRKKLSACARLKSLVETQRMEISSPQLIKQLKTFVTSGASFAGKPGTHDDLVSSTLLIARMIDTVISWSDSGEELKEGIGEDELYDDDGDGMPIVL